MMTISIRMACRGAVCKIAEWTRYKSSRNKISGLHRRIDNKLNNHLNLLLNIITNREFRELLKSRCVSG